MWGGKIVATLSIGMVMMMGCATSSAREGDPGWEDAGEADASVTTPSLAYEIPPQCPNGYALTYPPGSACMGTAPSNAHCAGVRGTGYPSFCAGPCLLTATSTPEVCDGIDNDCDGLLNENPGGLCDDGRGCTSDSCLGSIGCANSVGLSTCQEIRRPIAESRIAPDGYTWLMRRDNPRLEGRVFAQVQSQTGTMGNFTRTMSPSAGRIVSNGTSHVETEVPSPGWVWSENTVGTAGAVGNFRAPRMLLPATGAIDVGLYRHPAASGAAFEEVDWHYMQLAPEVLLVPVRVTVFTPASGTTLWTEAAVRQMLDPARVETTGASGGSTTVTVGSRELSTAVSPDDIWTQCNIQFRMVAYVPVVNAALATTLTNTCSCSSLDNSPNPIAMTLSTQPDNVVNIYIGGALANGCGVGDVSGLACGASNSLIGGSCAAASEPMFSHRSRGDRDAILLNQQFPFSNPQITFAHELGHFIGLTHSPHTYVDPMGVTRNLSQCLPAPNGAEDTVDVPNLLMGPGGGSGTPTITPMQCARSRCMAARWLETFTPTAASTARREAICAE